MKNLLAAIVLSIALPAVAQAQDTPAPKEDCCEKMKAEGKECCCKDMARKADAGHDEKQPDAKSPDHDKHQH